MNQHNQVSFLAIALFISVFILGSCQKEIYVEESLEGWTEASHGSTAEPNYAVVFNQNKVNRIDLVITEKEYASMQSDVQSIVGSSGGARPGGTQTFSDETPIYVPADFYFNGIQWYDVGVRYKGNSTLTSAYSQGLDKLPLRLNFDYFDESNPTITGQRFYGFKELSLSSNYNDESYVREKAASDIFQEFGVPVAQSAFYEIYLDSGEGPEYLGLYTMLEVIFDTMIENHFGSSTGNCYKPDGDGAMFGYSNFDLDDFGKKTNERVGDWSDIQSMYDALHDDRRYTDEEAYKSNLESIFDVDGFMKYLAANNTIQNWDTYGNMTHNYYLYHDPADDLIKWIAWDHNEAFQSGQNALSFQMNEVSDQWPLIAYLSDIEEYRTLYDDYIREFIGSSFNPSKMNSQYSSYAQLIASSVAAETNNTSFDSGIYDIKAHCYARDEAAESYLE